jgi:nanoRNase/pAp phosphatase (c-di-AMP/oligoRNAs hydrolase)
LHGLIVYTGAVTRAENKELLRHCRYTWRFASQLRPPRGHQIPAVFVDTAPWSGNVTIPPYAKPVAVIDHHQPARRKQSDLPFVDVRPDIGASATILHEYLKTAGIAGPPWLASIMAYAIATETMDLSRNQTERDIKAYTELMAMANVTAMGQMRHAPLPRSNYTQLQEAISGAMIYGRVAWSHLNGVKQPEIVAEIADLLCRMERITWAFCTAWQDSTLMVSLRSDKKGAHCGDLLRSVIRKNGSAGGHDRMAAGYVDLRNVPEGERDERRQEFVKALLARIEPRAMQPEPLQVLAKPLVG